MYKALLKHINKNTFLRNILIVSSGTAIAQSISIFTTPIITRFYSPDEFGLFSIVFAVISVMASFSTLRYEVAIPIEKKDKDAKAIIKLCFLILTTLTILIVIIQLIFVNTLIKYSQIQQMGRLLWLVPLFFFLTGSFRILSNWSLRLKSFKIIAKVKLIQSVSNSIIKIILGFFGVGVIGLFLGSFAQETAGINIFKKELKKSNFFLFKNTTRIELIEVAKRYKRFPIYQTWSQILLSLSPKLPMFFMLPLFGLEAVGFFGLASSIISAPINLIGSSISQVYFAEVSNYGKNKPDKILKLSYTIIKKLILIALFPLIIILLFGPEIFSIAFGNNWEEAGVIAQALIFLIIVKLIINPIMSCLNVLEMQNIQLIINIIRISIVVIVFYLSSKLDLDIYITILFYSISLSIIYLIQLFLVLRNLKERCGIINSNARLQE